MQNLNLGLLAHVDAGKTTLSENILYTSGAIRNLGRVDHKDTYLDNFEMEKERGITIFSKQARFTYCGKDFTLLDTPGHVDFSSEMERVLSVLDMAVLIVSAPEGVQSHTRTLWKLLEHYDIPTFIFVNKMDMQGADRDAVLAEIKSILGKRCVDIDNDCESALEEISSADEGLIEEYLETGTLCDDSIRHAVEQRIAFPVWFGSALKSDGIKELLDGIARYAPEPVYNESEFGARVFKITRGSSGERLTHLKVTGGKLTTRMVIPECGGEKIDQIRLYNGEKYETRSEASAGETVAVTGLSESYSGQGLGAEKEKSIPVIYVSAKTDVQSRVQGLKLGAEDYLVKPFDILELLVRMEKVLARAEKQPGALAYRDITVDVESRRVTRDGAEVTLKPMEYELLLMFMRHPGMVLTREELLHQVWGDEYIGETRTVDVHVAALRRKLDLNKELATVYKIGYRLETR